MKIKTQDGATMELTDFAIGTGGIKNNHVVWGVIGHEPDPTMYHHGRAWTIGVYKDKITAFRILSEIVQHEGDEPYEMPPEDTVLDL